MGGMTEPPIAFIVDVPERPAVEIRVNFGIFAGRSATSAEIDELARWLLDEVENVTIVAEERHQFDQTVEASVHQVRIELDHAPGDWSERRLLSERLRERADYWARKCIAERHGDAAGL
jgi:hypothetical protein